MKVLDVIKFEGDNHLMVWKHPAEDFNTHSTLIVREGQVALFFKNGQIADVYKAGRYVLSTGNIPLLRKLVEIPTDGVSTFSCQVYFVNLAEAMDVKWGLDYPASWEDPVYHIQVKVGASGNMSVRIDDPSTMVFTLVGAERGLTAKNLISYFQDLIVMSTKSYLAQVCLEQQIDVFNMDANLEIIADEIKKRVNRDFREYGFRLQRFTIARFVLPEGDPNYERLKRAIAEKTIGITEAQTAHQQANIAAAASADGEVIRSQGLAQALKNLGTTYTDKRVLDIAEDMAKNQTMNQVSDVASGIMMMRGAVGGLHTMQPINTGMNYGQQVSGMQYQEQPQYQQPQYQQSQQYQQPQQSAAAAVRKCVQCGAVIKADSKFCNKCGTKQPVVCPCCGKVLTTEDKFCSECGTKIQ